MGQLTSGLSPSPIQIQIRAPSNTDSERRILSKYRYLYRVQISLDTQQCLCEVLSEVSEYNSSNSEECVFQRVLVRGEMLKIHIC